MANMESLYIQFGCGPCAPPSWRNFDAGPYFWLQKYLPVLTPLMVRRGVILYPVRHIEYADVTKGLPVRANSAKAVYCSHVLEHLALSEFRAAIRNVYGYLASGGRFRLVVPDIEYLAKEYVADSNPEAVSRFMESTCLGEKTAVRGIRALPKSLFGRSRHLWMWDFKGISKELADAGFIEIHRADFNDSADPRFKEVEETGRWENCLGVECTKPSASSARVTQKQV
jgi:hypothetical protein